MASEPVRSDLRRVGRNSAAFILPFVMFLCALGAVFYGFIGYYSRVSLISEFQQSGTNIDYVFMQVEQVPRDEDALKTARESLRNTEQSTSSTLITTIAAGHTSEEYKNYLSAAATAESILIEATQILHGDYLTAIRKIDYEKPSLEQAQLFGNPEFKTETSAELQAELYRKLSPAIQDFRIKIVLFNAGYGNQINQIANYHKVTAGSLHVTVLEILVRNPQWASPDEIVRYEFDKSPAFKVDETAQRNIAQQRAVVASYRLALGWMSGILQWPTIVSTMVVILAAGWLGGIVSVMGAAIRPRRADTELSVELQEHPNISLIRRSVLGITAALGIFLFAGAGLLALTPQSGRVPTSGSIELSPYFVAFLAFISGFLADDAFLRLTSAGRALLQSRAKAKSVKADQTPDNAARTSPNEEK